MCCIVAGVALKYDAVICPMSHTTGTVTLFVWMNLGNGGLVVWRQYHF